MMKTGRLLKFTLSIAILAFLSTNVLAQTYPGNLVNTGNTGHVEDSVTAGVDVPYFVYPDPTLSPSFSGDYAPDGSATGTGNLSENAYWEWNLGWTTSGSGTIVSQGVDNNSSTGDLGPYITVNWNHTDAGDQATTSGPEVDSIHVTEMSNLGCNGDTSRMQVRIFDQPSFQPVDANNTLIERCGDQTGVPIELASIADNGVNTGDLKIRLDSIAVANVDPANPTSGNGDNLLRSSEDTIAVIPTPIGSGSLTDIQLFTYDVYVRNSDVTRYRFRFDGDGGISDQISRKTDYLKTGIEGTDPGSDPVNNQAGEQDWTYYAATDGGNGYSIDVIVYPQPNTGDIYYVPNDFDQ